MQYVNNAGHCCDSTYLLLFYKASKHECAFLVKGQLEKDVKGTTMFLAERTERNRVGNRKDTRKDNCERP